MIAEKPLLDAPFPYFGGKRTIAAEVWRHLGDTPNYIEPFFGSGAVLLNRPADHKGHIETVNDKDGYVCLAPNTKILRDNFRWANAGDVQPGDMLIGFDEFNGEAREGLRAPKHYRRFQNTKVVAARRIIRPSYRLTFSDGTVIVASEDHQWLGGSHKTGGRGWKWQTTKNLRCDCGEQRSWIMKICDVIQPEATYESGWLSGFFEGEGSIAMGPGWRVTLAQNNGPALDRANHLLHERSFSFTHNIRLNRQICHLSSNGGMKEVLRFLMQIRPERLIQNTINKLNQVSLYGRSHHAVGLIKKEYLGEVDVVAIETTSHTFIAEGLASHNCNFWRAIRHDPEQTAIHADNPVNENDLHARHSWLLKQKAELVAKLEGDPEYYDSKIAGWWAWGMSCWIGSGFCSGQGPWVVNEDRKLVHLSGAQGVNRQRVHLKGEQGVNRKRVHLASEKGVNHKRPHLRSAGGGVGVNRPTTDIYDWFDALADRLADVRVCCGDWSRICGPSPTYVLGLTGVFLDPPYSGGERQSDLYTTDSDTVASDVRKWCLENGDNPLLRIALCGYDGEHVMPDSWEVLHWKAAGGYGLQGNGTGRENRDREIIWFSPACLKVNRPKQMMLLPLDVRRTVLKRQVEKFNKENPDYYKESEHGHR